MHKNFLIIAGLSGALTVALGAFGAHGLKRLVNAETISTFETGIRYQFYHTFALLAVAILYEKFPNKFLIWSGNSFLAGMVLFCGSLYVLTALDVAHATGYRRVGIITPFGGLFLIAGWLLLVMAVYKNNF